ncbi:hypothetical protein CEXT_227551 [Caerostris extrusa]|uniref:Uncharacterized protein n=1 Tax=Caerostris extrusa TaxID=172846 RepID=A0AAV4WP70_CAEEX|nr:hypothetical protein CEXT_227551 [Caerostris extrusa]
MGMGITYGPRPCLMGLLIWSVRHADKRFLRLSCPRVVNGPWATQTFFQVVGGWFSGVVVEVDAPLIKLGTNLTSDTPNSRIFYLESGLPITHLQDPSESNFTPRSLISQPTLKLQTSSSLSSEITDNKAARTDRDDCHQSGHLRAAPPNKTYAARHQQRRSSSFPPWREDLFSPNLLNASLSCAIIWDINQR